MRTKFFPEVGIKAGRKKGRPKHIRWVPALLGGVLFPLFLFSFLLGGEGGAAEKPALSLLPTEEEVATEKFLSQLETALAQKFFDFRTRQVIRVAIFDFTDGDGNVVKGGVAWADRIARRLLSQPQFDVVSHDRVTRYLSWNSLGTVGKLDAAGLRLLQRRINTMDPGNGIHVLLTGEIAKGAGRTMQVQAYLTNFEQRLGERELEKNLIDLLSVSGEIPLPTEKALQEISEIVVRGGKQSFSEGRLLILANTRGYPLVETEYLSQFGKDQPFAWDKIPYALVVGKEEYTMPKQVQVGAGKVTLYPLEVPMKSPKRLEHSFLHGKCATNEVYFDEMIPAMRYQVSTSFIDFKNNQTYSEMIEVEVYPGATTVVILSFFVPSEKERIRNRTFPRINVYQLNGKGLEILPRG
jgi:hypothetical protein